MFRLLDRFIPTSLLDLEKVRWRARFLVGWSLLSVVLTVFSILLGLMAPMSNAADIWMGVVCCFGFGAVPLLLRAKGSLALVGWIPAIGLTLSVLGLSFSAGGLFHHSMPALLTVPIIASIFAGRRFGGFITLALAMIVGAMGVGHHLNWFSPPTNIGESLLLRAFVYIASLMFVMGLVYVYERVQQQIESRLETSDARYALAIAATNDGLFDWDIRHDEVFLSTEFTTLLGYETTPEVKSPFAESLYPAGSTYTQLQAGVELHLTTRAPFDIETRMRKANGKASWFHIRGGAVWEEDKPVRMVGFIRDISRQKQLELVKEEFISNVGHELRTPLTSIIGALQLLDQEGLISPEQRKEMLQIANRNSERLLGQIDNLLDLQKLQSGPMPLVRIWADLPTLAEEAVAQLQPSWRQKQLQVKLDIAPTTPPMQLDPDRTRQALLHLLADAIKFSPRGETINVHVKPEKSKPPQVQVSIVDRGAGIPEEAQSFVFDRFAHWEATKQAQGTGLGMALAKRIAEAHGGNVAFVTSPEEGSTFSIYLPVSIPNEPTNSEPALDEAPIQPD